MAKKKAKTKIIREFSINNNKNQTMANSDWKLG